MTGFGRARTQTGAETVSVEISSVNNRYLKISTKCPETLARHKGDVERVIRSSIERGTVQLLIRVERIARENPYSLDPDILRDYWRQLESIHDSAGIMPPRTIDALLTLPGVVVETTDDNEVESVWPTVEVTLRSALDQHREFRAAEGRSMVTGLGDQLSCISLRLDEVSAKSPGVISGYRDRILERVSQLLAETDITLEPESVIREVSIFAERCDINEEITRLRSHLDRFQEIMRAKTANGRRLEFVGQEMFREVNTIGSKANDIDIAHSVVEMKAAIEKIREILQNVE